MDSAYGIPVEFREYGHGLYPMRSVDGFFAPDNDEVDGFRV